MNVISFIVLSVCGLLIENGFDNSATNSRKQTALAMAEQSDLFFVRAFSGWCMGYKVSFGMVITGYVGGE